MAEYVLDDAPPPPQLIEAWRLERWGFPNAGGTLDQPNGLIDRCTHTLNAYSCLDAYKRNAGRLASWGNKNPKAHNFVSLVLEHRFNQRHGQ